MFWLVGSGSGMISKEGTGSGWIRMFWLVGSGSGMISKVGTGSVTKPSGSTTGTVRYCTCNKNNPIFV